jgi:nitronate monooxygenase
VRNPFLRSLEARSERQIPIRKVEAGEHTVQLDVGVKGKNFWVTPRDLTARAAWAGRASPKAAHARRYDHLRQPEERDMIRKDQKDCMGCLSHCGFSSVEGP